MVKSSALLYNFQFQKSDLTDFLAISDHFLKNFLFLIFFGGEQFFYPHCCMMTGVTRATRVTGASNEGEAGGGDVTIAGQ